VFRKPRHLRDAPGQRDRAPASFPIGRALREESLREAGRIAEAAGARLVCEVFPTRLQRSAGRVAIERLPYFAEAAVAALEGTEQIILIGTKAPVAFFPYPGKPAWLAPENCELHTLATVDQDPLPALRAVADRLGAAVACPGRKVIALQADVSAMYTLQALWTMAREQTDVTVVIMNNRSYAILNIELARCGPRRPGNSTRCSRRPWPARARS
jgi:thiamine pyrophosphate-dependent acetolactate synthase large subunit-like protein